MTLHEWLRKGEEVLLASPHPGNAHRDAELLLLHVVHQERAGLLARWKECLRTAEGELYKALIERRLGGEPIQYILGETEFYGLPFWVSSDVLIPRPETEHLVEKALQAAASYSSPRMVDVGTGSGAIAVTLAQQLPEANITAIDLSAPALAVAAENATRNGVQIRFLRGDLLAPVARECFDIVVSNPPYVPAIDRDSLAVEVRDFEPALALFADRDGLGIYRRLIPAAFAVLNSDGFLILEIGFEQSPAVAYLLASSGFQQIEFLPDLQGIPRVACARKG
jgi:release factor glutamine methyltransferase